METARIWGPGGYYDLVSDLSEPLSWDPCCQRRWDSMGVVACR